MRAKNKNSRFSTVNRNFFSKILGVFLFLTAPALAPAQNNLPDLGEISSTALPLHEERQIGEEVMQTIRRDASFLNDIDVEFYLANLGARLKAGSSAPETPLYFFALINPAINAFALPGGFIGVYSGLFVTAQSESELAGVLSHEIAHVTQRHIARRVYQNKQMLLASLLGLGAAALAIPTGGASAAAAAITLSQGAVAHNSLAFSRDLESEADRLGFETLNRAALDPRAMAGFFTRLLANKNEKNALVYLQTHPLTSARLTDMQNRDSKMPYRQIVSSEDFYLIRARLAVLQTDRFSARENFKQYVENHRYPNRAAAFYGLAFAYFQNGDFQKAENAVNAAAQISNNRLILHLKTQILLAAKKTNDAVKLARDLHKKYPHNAAVDQHFAQTLVQSQNFKEAFEFLQNFNKKTPSVRGFQWQAEAALHLKMPAQYHAALGESALLEGLFPAAAEHFEKAEAAAGKDFYLASQIHARWQLAKRAMAAPK